MPGEPWSCAPTTARPASPDLPRSPQRLAPSGAATQRAARQHPEDPHLRTRGLVSELSIVRTVHLALLLPTHPPLHPSNSAPLGGVRSTASRQLCSQTFPTNVTAFPSSRPTAPFESRMDSHARSAARRVSSDGSLHRSPASAVAMKGNRSVQIPLKKKTGRSASGRGWMLNISGGRRFKFEVFRVEVEHETQTTFDPLLRWSR